MDGLRVFDCVNLEDMMVLFNEGMRNRSKDAHLLNKDSSRSHCILTIYVIREEDGPHLKRSYGKISFVDLAGSE